MNKIINILVTISGRTTAVALGALIAAAVPAFGTTVDYSTTGTFSTTGTGVLTGTGGETLTFNPISTSNITPATNSLGFFTVTNATGGTLTPPAGETFTLTVTQTSPAGTGGLASIPLTGTIDDTGAAPSGGLVLTLALTNFSVNGINYQLVNLTNGNQVDVGTTITNIQADITGAVPEPATVALMGGGLALLGLTRLRRKAAK
ncbi:MAG: PEP-CTERM sorting domain-containing protein [Acidobacteriaceae bacterium]|nr:PEP-CTERM sorting domain-containing protein [Acidobacteriaceae bacterium]